jgi:hypothetical protein
MKYAIEMGSGAMMCIPSFVNSGVQTLIEWGYTDRKVISLAAKPTCLGPRSNFWRVMCQEECNDLKIEQVCKKQFS